MKFVKVTFALCFALAIPNMASAQWTQLASTDQATHFIDRTSIRQNSEFVEVWWLMNLNSRFASQLGFASIVGYARVDCKKRLALTLKKTTHSEPNGGGIGVPSVVEDTWQSSRPQTLSQSLIQGVCNQ